MGGSRARVVMTGPGALLLGECVRRGRWRALYFCDRCINSACICGGVESRLVGCNYQEHWRLVLNSSGRR